jgi:hypothetical protein
MLTQFQRMSSILMIMSVLGLVQSVYADFYVIPVKTKGLNTIKVAPSGGDYQSPVTAMNAISDASASNPYRIVIAAGVYILDAPLYLKPFVDVVGMGDVTIKGAIGGTAISSSAALIHGENNASISHMTIINEGYNATGYSLGMYNDGASPRIHDVTLYAKGGSWNLGMKNIAASAPILSDVSIFAIGGDDAKGMMNNASFPTMRGGSIVADANSSTANDGVYNYPGSRSVFSDVSISVTGSSPINRGVYTDAATTIISHCDITATDTSLYTRNASKVLVSDSVLRTDATTLDTSKNVCFETTNGSGTSLSESCQTP